MLVKEKEIPQLEIIEASDLTPEKKKAIIESGKPVYVKGNWVNDYQFVYGTLRMCQGNYRRLLKDTSDYIDTVRLKQFKYTGGLSAAYYGDDTNYGLVVDIFKVKQEGIAEANERVDWLEGCGSGYFNFPSYYTVMAMPITLSNGETVVAKGYPIPDCANLPEVTEGDYIGSQVTRTPQVFIEHLKTNHPDNAQNFINFYNLNTNDED